MKSSFAAQAFFAGSLSPRTLAESAARREALGEAAAAAKAKREKLKIPRFVPGEAAPAPALAPAVAPPKASPFDQFARSMYKTRNRRSCEHDPRFPSLPSRAYEVQKPKPPTPKPGGARGASWGKLKAARSMQSTVNALRPGSARLTIVSRIVSGDPTYGDVRGDQW